jgi:hypothetical protein
MAIAKEGFSRAAKSWNAVNELLKWLREGVEGAPCLPRPLPGSALLERAGNPIGDRRRANDYSAGSILARPPI